MTLKSINRVLEGLGYDDVRFRLMALDGHLWVKVGDHPPFKLYYPADSAEYDPVNKKLHLTSAAGDRWTWGRVNKS